MKDILVVWLFVCLFVFLFFVSPSWVTGECFLSPFSFLLFFSVTKNAQHPGGVVSKLEVMSVWSHSNAHLRKLSKIKLKFALPCIFCQVFRIILLMAEILHQLIGSLSHHLQGLYIPGGAGFLPSRIVNWECQFIGAGPPLRFFFDIHRGYQNDFTTYIYIAKMKKTLNMQYIQYTKSSMCFFVEIDSCRPFHFTTYRPCELF